MTSPSPRANLIAQLAQHYYRRADIERVATTSGLSLSMIQWDDRPVNAWGSVLSVAEDQGRVEALFDTVLQEKGGHDSLRSAMDVYRQDASAGQPGAAGQPALSNASAMHLQTRLGELQSRYAVLTKRIAAVNTDINLALSSEARMIYEEKRLAHEVERDRVFSEIKDVERQLAQQGITPETR